MVSDLRWFAGMARVGAEMAKIASHCFLPGNTDAPVTLGDIGPETCCMWNGPMHVQNNTPELAVASATMPVWEFLYSQHHMLAPSDVELNITSTCETVAGCVCVNPHHLFVKREMSYKRRKLTATSMQSGWFDFGEEAEMDTEPIDNFHWRASHNEMYVSLLRSTKQPTTRTKLAKRKTHCRACTERRRRRNRKRRRNSALKKVREPIDCSCKRLISYPTLPARPIDTSMEVFLLMEYTSVV